MDSAKHAAAEKARVEAIQNAKRPNAPQQPAQIRLENEGDAFTGVNSSAVAQ
jgi:hypothetical protein